MRKELDEWDEKRERDSDALEQQRSYQRSIKELIIQRNDKSGELVDIIGIQMFSYCEEHDKHFPAGESCPMPH